MMPSEILKGMSVTFRSMFRKRNTTQYPEQKKPTSPRFHGRHQLNRYPDGLERCIGCELCAYACQADAIYVQGADNLPEARYSVGERYAAIYQINYNRCIFCGLCIEACPTRALTMTNEYELSSETRQGLVYDKPDLLAAVPAGAKAPPHADGGDHGQRGQDDEDQQLGPLGGGGGQQRRHLATPSSEGSSRSAWRDSCSRSRAQTGFTDSWETDAWGP